MSALPEIAYDVYPEPQHVTPQEDVVVVRQAPIFIEQAPVFAPAPFVERVAPAPVRVAPAPVVERLAPAPVFAPNFVGPAYGPAPVYGPGPAPVYGLGPIRAPVTTGAWPAPKTSVQQVPAAQNPANQKASTATAPKNAQTAAPKAPAKNAQTIKPIGSTTEKLAAQRK